MTREARIPRRGVAPISLLIALAAVPALLLGGLWQYADANVPPPTTTTTTTLPPDPTAEMSTELLSYRRDPDPLAERVAAEEQAAALTARVAETTALIPDGSCLRMVADEVVVAEVDPLLAVIPASNEKLLVAAVALEVLGLEHVFTTELLGAAPVDGVVPGSVYLVGGGDPVLRTADFVDPQRSPAINTTSLDALADQVVAAGITTIDGDIVGDGSRYDDEFAAPTWGPDIGNYDAGPYDALLVNDGLLGDGTAGNYGLNPNRSAAVAFENLLLARGVVITGTAANMARPADIEFATLAAIDSSPLPEILQELLYTSDNNTAELMTKEIGLVATGEGTRQAGLDTIRAQLIEWDVPTEELLLYDGSGLSRDNRTTCTTLSTLLAATPVADDLIAALPVAGVSGTMEAQLLDTPAEGQLAAKTGTLTDVKALSGSQPDGAGVPVEFAVVMNGTGVDDPTVYTPIWTAVVDLIADLPIVVEPDPTPFEPR